MAAAGMNAAAVVDATSACLSSPASHPPVSATRCSKRRRDPDDSADADGAEELFSPADDAMDVESEARPCAAQQQSTAPPSNAELDLAGVGITPPTSIALRL